VLAIRTPRERFGAALATLDAHPVVRGTVLVVVAGIVCWLLARHITAPLVRLRVAAARMAEGDLEARASRPLTSRHDEIGALGRDFDQMAERLSALVKTERQLLADVSHELRSPLARLTVAAGLLRQRGGDGPELERIDREVARVDTIIGQSLTLARVSSGLGSGSRETFDLSNLVQEIVADGDFEARAANRRVVMTSVDACSSTGVPDLIRSAIENVVRNAIRHTPTGTSVDVSLRVADDHARVTVRDHGPGIPDALLTDVFLPFRRADGPGRPVSNGAGLGLAIADRVVRMHGGSVVARNASDGGLAVEISLPGRQRSSVS
jgi:two-component system sensor histidine kinase CpxA